MRPTSILCLALAAAGVHAGGLERRVDLRALLLDSSLGLDPNTVISFPGDNSSYPDPNDAFAAATSRWSLFNPPTYSAAVTPATVEDVATIVRLAAQYDFRFLATGGRHGYTSTLARMTDGVALDLGALDGVSVDRFRRTLTVGPGVVFGDIFQPLYDAGLQIQTGVCSCPGMIGVTIGSGVGRLEGIYGLVADALASVRMVTARGDIIDVSPFKNPDLWWGIRGAGANFGIIVEATYKVHPLYRGGQFTVLDFILPAEANRSYFEILEGFMGDDRQMPRDLSASSVYVWNATTGQPEIVANWVYNGPEAEARRVLASVLELPAPASVVVEVPWSQLVATSVFGLDPYICARGQYITVLGANLRQIEASTLGELFDSFVDFHHQFPDAASSVITIESFPTQGTESYPDVSSAYPWRDVKSLVMFQPVSASPNRRDALNWMQSAREWLALRSGYTGYGGLRTYINYSQGNEQLEQIFGINKLPRLAALKRRWDPTNVFRYMNPLPTQYP